MSVTMADDLSKLWDNFSLIEEEGVEVEIQVTEMKGVVTRGQS